MGRVTTAQKSMTMAAAATMSPSLPESGPASAPRQPSRCCPLLPDWCFIGGGGGKRSRLGKVSQVVLGAVINLVLLGLFVLHFYRNGFKRREWLWVILICVATILVTYAFLLLRCIYDKSCNRGTKKPEEDRVVGHNDPNIC